MITVAIANRSTVCTDQELAPIVAAIQKQVSHDFAPIWAVDAKLVFVPKGAAAPAGAWLVVVADDCPAAGALGYHDLTKDGQPCGIVGARTDKQAGSSLSVTISHEVLEMLADPWIMATVLIQGGRHHNHLFAQEACDACEDDSLGYAIDGVMVSDFVTPAWFIPGLPPGTKYDFKGHITEALQILHNGYIGVLNFTSSAQWTQINARDERHREASAHPMGSRKEKRNVHLSQRRTSTAH